MFPFGELEEWLRDTLSIVRGHKSVRGPSFGLLYDETSIELHVVAANISRGEQVVFNHKQTPLVDVVQAVLASSAIPGAFRPGHLLPVRDQEDEVLRETVIDGGVWANYPDFVFRDRSYRQWAGIEPVEVTEPVLGLILTEPGDEARLSAARYLQAGTVLRPFEQAVETERLEAHRRDRAEESRLVKSVEAFVGMLALAAFPAALFTEGLARVSSIVIGVVASGATLLIEGGTRFGSDPLDEPSWSVTTRRGRFAYNFLRSLHQEFRGLVVLLLPLAAVVAGLVGGAFLLDRWMGDPGLWGYIGFTPVLWAVYVLGGTALVAAALAAASLYVLRTAAPMLVWSARGTLRTLLAASTRPPAWVGSHRDDHVLRVPVAGDVDTMTFDLTGDPAGEPGSDETLLELMHRTSYESASVQLEELGPTLEAHGA